MDSKNNVDMTPLEIAEEAIRALDGKKAKGIKLLHVEKQTILADYFIICSGSSGTQIAAFADEIEFKLNERGVAPGHIEGIREASWVLLDYGSVVVHIQNREAREFYNLEKLWSASTEVDIAYLLTEN